MVKKSIKKKYSQKKFKAKKKIKTHNKSVDSQKFIGFRFGTISKVFEDFKKKHKKEKIKRENLKDKNREQQNKEEQRELKQELKLALICFRD